MYSTYLNVHSYCFRLFGSEASAIIVALVATRRYFFVKKNILFSHVNLYPK